MNATEDPRASFAATLVDLAATDARVCMVVNDSISSSSAAGFLARFPDRLFDAGIAEQNMVGVAAGLANAGMIPFVCAASCFLTGRALEQIKVDIALSDANVKLCGNSAGFAYGSLGPTHHAIEDIAWMRVLPGLRIAAPSDATETAQAVRAAHEHVGPVFIRLNRIPVPSLQPHTQPFEFGKATELRQGEDVTLFSMGFAAHGALEAASLLAREGIEARVLNMSSLAPLDVKAISRACRETRRLVCVEDHQREGGLFSAVASVVVRGTPVPMLSISVPGVFAPVGSTEDLHALFGLQPEAIATRVAAWLRGLSRPGEAILHG
ncbi:transketolase family protein [Ramlibacter tataouinensis]|uniref:1-deoxy-D-xylulose-5-phosphate pyruvate-lyase (Carboxylating) n=1 Tax=Ramlibacter tataouinensis (strain ATCC BAA-407 / DSM 14655 / LMG 21543 / TTB310) TaxID=365046 RepID=F5XXB8_RAMTT|nr:transketolase C-terminal domain-containing protein [Ramlibacter tataouinensis]AEG94253.1 1-deoxy-D-xylulose-5-phosphate pyruvate-lyase (carboxylating) [Ramlibacter tataouinensis TTB310]